ncbi:hypothetical protein CRG98_046454 [Punica granatum]|uniref:GDSL esterase/lipase n=1 Tax=Punica granatum TaxID=22663 RepID=A0A2I0HN39_PUNGR|nr:hypothetical protein CRG98_046454 [Punica granatum]
MEDEGQEKSLRISSVSFHISSLWYVLLLCLCVLPGARTRCERKPVIFNFGDSNSDTGGFSAALGVTFKLPFGRAFLREQNGRISDGRLMIDFFCKSFLVTRRKDDNLQVHNY